MQAFDKHTRLRGPSLAWGALTIMRSTKFSLIPSCHCAPRENPLFLAHLIHTGPQLGELLLDGCFTRYSRGASMMAGPAAEVDVRLPDVEV